MVKGEEWMQLKRRSSNLAAHSSPERTIRDLIEPLHLSPKLLCELGRRRGELALSRVAAAFEGGELYVDNYLPRPPADSTPIAPISALEVDEAIAEPSCIALSGNHQRCPLDWSSPARDLDDGTISLILATDLHFTKVRANSTRFDSG